MASFSVVTRETIVRSDHRSVGVAPLEAVQAALHAAAFQKAGGVQVVRVADAALVEVNSLLEKAAHLARQAAVVAPTAQPIRDAEYEKIAAEIERIQGALNGGAAAHPSAARVVGAAPRESEPAEPLPITSIVRETPLEAEHHWLKQAFAALRPPVDAPSALDATSGREDRTDELVRRIAGEIADRPRTAALVQAGVYCYPDDSLLR